MSATYYGPYFLKSSAEKEEVKLSRMKMVKGTEVTKRYNRWYVLVHM